MLWRCQVSATDSAQPPREERPHTAMRSGAWEHGLRPHRCAAQARAWQGLRRRAASDATWTECEPSPERGAASPGEPLCVLAGRIHAVGRCSAGPLPVRPPGGVPEPARAAAATSAVCCARAQAPPRGPCGWRGRGGTHVSRRAGGEQQREGQRQCRQPGQPRQPAVERLDTGHTRRCVPGAVQTRLCDVQRGRPPRGACRKLSACLTPLCARLPARVPRRAGWAAEHVGLVDDAHCADQHVHVPGHGGADRLPGTWQTCGESLTDGGLTRRLNLPLQEGTHKSFEYGRYGNPTTRAAEDKLRCVSQGAV